MNWRELQAEVASFIASNGSIFDAVEIHYEDVENRPCIGDWSDPTRLGALTSRTGIGACSGIYYFYAKTGEVLYIGKATKSNLHHRAWGHLKTPTEPEGGWRRFPKHSLNAPGCASDFAKDVTDGNVHLGVIEISEPDVVSLVEVYLHTVHKRLFGRLPVFNKQIG